MSSPINNPYNYTKASTLATRTLISPDSKPSHLSASGSHDTDVDAPVKPGLQRRTTSNYEDACRAAGQANPSSVEPTNEPDRPGLDRKISYKMSDMKRGAMEQTLAGAPVTSPRYHSTSS